MLSALSALAPMGTDVILPALPIMALALHTSDGMIQATLGAFILAFALGQLIVGPLSDHHGLSALHRAAAFARALCARRVFVRRSFCAHQRIAAWQFVAVMATYAFTFGLLVPGAFAAGIEPAGDMAGVAAGLLGATQTLGGSIGSAINGALPFRANVDVGLSVGIAGIGVAAAYIWSVHAARLASRPPWQFPVQRL